MSDQNVAEPVMAIPVETPVEGPIVEATPVETPVTTARFTPPVNGNGQPKRPLASFRANTDRSTSIEVSVWLNVHKSQDGTEFEQLSMTIKRNYRDQNGAWVSGGSYRSHDIPVLMFLLTKAYNMAIDRRTDDSSLPF